MIVTYTPEEVEEAIKAAHGRQDYAESHKLPNYDGRAWTPEQEREFHEVGAISEWCVAKGLGLKFRPMVGDLDGTDLGILEVRSRQPHTGTDLAMRRGDEKKLRKPFLLCHIRRDRLTVQLVGWLVGWEAWERRTPENLHFGVWYIPPPYHTVRSLEDWIAAKHPEHWCPEKYRERPSGVSLWL